MDDSVLHWFESFLHMNEKQLKMVIDLYNKDMLNPKARIALEAIDGCEGPGDRVVA